MLLRDLIKGMPGDVPADALLVSVHGISYDSRQVHPGDLFVAIRGEKADGAHFIAEAIRRGAAAVACDHETGWQPEVPVVRVPDARKFLAETSRVFYLDPAARLKLVGITGTNGKTTTSYLLDAIFRGTGHRSCLVGTLGMRIDDRQFPSSHTTPESSDLARFLQEAVHAGCTYGALEVSSHALVLKRVFGTHFAVGVFTNLTPEHLDFHADMESYFQAKRLLFTPPGANSVGKAVINADDEYGRRLASDVTCPAWRYGMDDSAEVHLLSQRTGIDGTDLRLSTPAGELALRTRMIGEPNTSNIMAAVAAALSLDLDLAGIRRGIESVAGVPGRMEIVAAGNFTVIVDYAHTPDALEKLLETVRRLTHGRLITVFGCGGDRDRKKRPLMGEIATRLSDAVVATSDNPRTEDPVRILHEIEPGLQRGGAAYQLQPDRREAIRSALALAHRDDVVLIAGKGHEDYQIIGTRVIPFDDRVIVQELIHQMHNAPGERDCGELHQ